MPPGVILIILTVYIMEKNGHLRLARECGVALHDFDSAGQKAILAGSYGMIYVSGCNLKPILNAKEWISEMQKGKERSQR